MRYYLFLLPVFLLTIFISPLHANIIYVPGDSTTIQGGINGASTGDTVMVDPGTYYEHDIDFLGKAITVMGTDPEDSAVVSATVVDGDSLGSVFYFHSGEDSMSVLAGLTITKGFYNSGGGIFCENNSSPIIAHNIITENTANHGGGIYCSSSSPAIINNIISNNFIFGNGGGGIYCWDSYSAIMNNTIIGNSAIGTGGGGIDVNTSSLNIINNIIAGNIASTGGGIHCSNPSSLVISGNSISNNTAIGEGGGVSCWRSSPTIANNVIALNSAGSGGGIFSRQESYPTIFNNTIVQNTASTGGAISIQLYCSPIISGSILWNNSATIGPEIHISFYSSLAISYSDVEGGQSAVYFDSGCTLNWGAGMIDADPLFISPDNEDYHLQSSSPCIDAGDPLIFDACRPPGLGDERSDMGAYGGEENCRWVPNSAPVIISYPDTSAIAGLEYFYDVDAEDSEGDTLSFSLQVAPYWLSINSITGIITGVPPLEAEGDTTVSVVVEDGFGGFGYQTYPLHVLPQIGVTLTPEGPTTIPKGEILYFNTYIQNNRENTVEGDYWLSVMFPDSSELLIPEILLNYPNPLHGQIFPYGFVELSNEFWVHPRADTGSYQLIGRIGTYPNGIVDEESFEFQVVE